MATGRMLIAAERQRQIDSEGWTPEHDDQHGARSLELAALCYRNKHAAKEGCGLPDLWPWDKQWWKPKGYQRNLERAGALYLAAADVAERAGDYQYHNKLLEDADICATEITAIISGQHISEDKKFVVVGADHPVIGSIYLNVIPDSLVGFSDIYEITTRLTFAEIWNSNWRLQSPSLKLDSQLYDESVLKTRMQYIDWYDNAAISQMCKEHNISIDELYQWCSDLTRWKDIPVSVEKKPYGSDNLVPMTRIL